MAIDRDSSAMTQQMADYQLADKFRLETGRVSV